MSNVVRKPQTCFQLTLTTMIKFLPLTYPIEFYERMKTPFTVCEYLYKLQRY